MTAPRIPTAAATMSGPSNGLPEITALTFVTTIRAAGTETDMMNLLRSVLLDSKDHRKHPIHSDVKSA